MNRLILNPNKIKTEGKVTIENPAPDKVMELVDSNPQVLIHFEVYNDSNTASDQLLSRIQLDFRISNPTVFTNKKITLARKITSLTQGKGDIKDFKAFLGNSYLFRKLLFESFCKP